MNPSDNNTQLGANTQPAQPAAQPAQPAAQPAQPAQPAAQPAQPAAQPLQEVAVPQEVTVVTAKRKSKGGGVLFIIIIALLIVFVVKIDEIKDYYEKNIEPNIGKTKPTTPVPSNLYGGFILIGSENSSMTINNIKFYNVKKYDNMEIMLTFKSSEDIENVKNKKLYVELYDKNKELLDKHLFDAETVKKDNSTSFSFRVDEDIYNEVYYAKVVDNSTIEKIESTKLICKFEKEETNAKLNYKISFNFINKELYNYSVEKTLDTTEKNNSYYTLLKTEFDEVSKSYNATFNNNKLVYSIDYKSEKGEYSPEYKKGTTYIIIKKRMELKDWKCE